jgi:hypothetical protein
MADEPAIVTSTVVVACARGTMPAIAPNNSTAKIDFIRDIVLIPLSMVVKTLTLHMGRSASRREKTPKNPRKSVRQQFGDFSARTADLIAVTHRSKA